MNLETCKKCKYRKMIFIKNFENKQDEFCCIDSEYLYTYTFTYTNIISYVLTNKWKRMIFSIFHSIWFKFNKQKHINNLFKNTQFLKIHYFGGYECPYRFEHQISDWNIK